MQVTWHNINEYKSPGEQTFDSRLFTTKKMRGEPLTKVGGQGVSIVLASDQLQGIKNDPQPGQGFAYLPIGGR